MNENPIIKLFSSVYSLSPETIKDFQAIIEFKQLPKNAHLLETGQIARNMYFISKGLARVYYLMNDKEVTDYFAIDGQFIGAVPSLFTRQPSQKAVHLIENSDIFYFNADKFEECCLKHPDLGTASRRFMTFALIQEQERIESLRFYSAKERYFLMEKNYPGITNRCPLQYIASYIGTTQVSVSRIRSGQQ